MKNLLFILILSSVSSSFLYSQEVYGERLSPYIDGRGADLYNEANKTAVNPSLLSKSELRVAEKHALRRKIMLMAEANRRLHFDIIETRSNARKAYRAQSHENMIADAWHNSPTGRRDGRTWSDLYDDERNEFRMRYINFYNQKYFIDRKKIKNFMRPFYYFLKSLINKITSKKFFIFNFLIFI